MGDSQLMVPMAVMALAMATARGRLMLRPSPRLMPGMDMVVSTATDSQLMVPMAVMVLAMAMERGLLMPSPRLMPGTDMVAFMATDSQPMAATATDCGARSKRYQKLPQPIISCNIQ